MSSIQAEHGVVLEMRRIREQISRDIQGMTLHQELAYFDQLLADPQRPEPKVDEYNLKRYRDLKNVIETAREEGRKQGRLKFQTEGKIKLVSIALEKGYSREEISELTGLTLTEIEVLKTQD